MLLVCQWQRCDEERDSCLDEQVHVNKFIFEQYALGEVELYRNSKQRQARYL